MTILFLDPIFFECKESLSFDARLSVTDAFDIKAAFQIKAFVDRKKPVMKKALTSLFCMLLRVFLASIAVCPSAFSGNLVWIRRFSVWITFLRNRLSQHSIANKSISVFPDPVHPFSQLGCTLPYKFYHWNHEVLEVSSKALKRDVQHKVRAYYNLTSTCYPEKRDDGQVYGDVAEFYDENATFMGFAIYLGQGLYCPLPHSGYAAWFY